MIPICELKYSNVFLNRDQKHKGRCIVEFKEHKTEYFQLTEEENAGYFAELAKVAKAIIEDWGCCKGHAYRILNFVNGGNRNENYRSKYILGSAKMGICRNCDR